MAISDNMRNSLLTAGLNILAANDGSRPGLSAIGAGGLAGMQAFQQGQAAEQAALEQQAQQEAIQAATQQYSPEMQQLMMQNPEAAADLLFRQQMAAHEEQLARERPVSVSDRYQNVPGVGLVDLAGQGGPEVAIAGQQGPDTVINNIAGQAETEWAKQTAKTGASAVQELQKGINSREQQGALLDQILSVAEDAPSGPLANAELFAGQIGQALGIETEGVAAGEVFRAASNQLALLVRGNPEGGLPGAASERDVKFLLDSGPQLAQTKAGRKALAQISKETLEYKNRVAKAEQNYRQKNLGSVVGFDPSKVKKPNVGKIINEARGIVQREGLESGNISTQQLQGMSDDELSKLWQ